MVAPDENALPLSENRASYMHRMLTLLEATVAIGESATVSEVASATEMPISSVSRILTQLADWNFLQRDGRGRYAAGFRAIHLAITLTERLYNTDELRRATERLSQETGESVTAGLLVHDTLVIVARTDSVQHLRAVNRVGEVIPPATSALGKAVLAALDPTRRLELLQAAGDEDPETTLRGIGDELIEAAMTGHARDEETFVPGLRCRAVPILDARGEPRGGLSVGGPAMRFSTALADQAVEPLLAEARAFSIQESS